jgi:hypothetical protein
MVSERPAALPSLVVLWFAILAGPVAWAAHLTIEYFLVTVHCQLNGGSTSLYMDAVTAATVVLCVAGGLVGLLIWRQLSGEHGSQVDRARFMAGAGVLLSLLFLVGIVLATVPVHALEACNEVH